MDKIRRFVAQRGVACLGVSIFALCMGYVFGSAFPKFAALLSPDAGPFFSYAYRTDLLERFMTGGAFTPHVFYWLVFPPLYAHELTYMLDSLILTLAGVYYLSGRRVQPVAAWMGGLSLGLCGYTFTLFAAGHRGYFHMFACAVWAFGLLIRCFEARRLFHFAALGLVFAWGATCQPDVLVLLGIVAAAYALWLTWISSAAHACGSAVVGESERSGPRTDGRWRGLGRTVLAVWPRFGVSLAVLFLAGFGSLRSAMTTTMASRDEQIASVTGTGQKQEASQGAESKKAQQERWLFATGWSLPPEDVLEFVAPGVFGDESMQMPHPYWGRLGRPADEVFQKGRMMPNYRGHTVYLGVVSVIFALFGVVAWWPVRKRAQAGAPLSSPAADSRLPAAPCVDVPFWCGVWVVCLILAMGRYTPVYRLFYALPYMDYIRAPVKFHHLVEVATAFLAGFGMDAFLRALSADGARLRRQLIWLAGGLAAALALAAGLMLANQAGVAAHIKELGLGPVSEALSRYAVRNLMRSVVLSAGVAVLAYLCVKRSDRAVARAGWVIVLVVALDLASVAHRYVRLINVEPFYRAHAVVDAVKRDAAGRFVNVINYVTPNAWAQDWFSTSLSLNGIRNLAPGGADRETPYGKMFDALQNDPVRLWRLCGIEYVIVPRKGCEALVSAGILKPVLDFELGQGVVRQVPPSQSSILLARVREATGLPRFVTAWTGGLPVSRQAEAVARDRPDVTDAPPPAAEGSGLQAAAEVRLLAQRGQPGVTATRVRVSSKQAGLLIFTERWMEGLEAEVDGKAVTVHTADCDWPAALVPAGEHEVVLRRKRDWAFPLAGALTALAVLVWGIVSRVLQRRSCPAG